MKIVIVGAGQVGTGAGLNAVVKNVSDDVTFYDTEPKHIRELNEAARENGVGTVMRATSNRDDFIAKAKDADLVILATPPDQYEELTAWIAPHLRQDAVITDVGSVRRYSIAGVTKGLARVGREDIAHEGGHPNYGTEKQGPTAAAVGMYSGKTVFLDEVPEGASKARKRAHAMLEHFWQAQEASTPSLKPEVQDSFFGVTSHLQHGMIAFPLMVMASDKDGLLMPDYLAGTSLRNTTRVAATGPGMLLSMYKGNTDIIGQGASGLGDRIGDISACILTNDVHGLYQELSRAREYRVALAAADKRNGTPRENISGELADFLGHGNVAQLSPQEAVRALQQAGKEKAFAKAVLLPLVVGAGAMLNAQNLLAAKIDLPNMINPSFLDGSAPALNDPGYVAPLLMANKMPVLEAIGTYRKLARASASAIATGNAGEMKHLIAVGNSLREQMKELHIFPRRAEIGQATASSEAVRAAYVIDPAELLVRPRLLRADEQPTLRVHAFA